MNKSKTSVINGKTIHYSVGVIITDEQQRLLLIDRATPPFGLAGVAGHVDEGEEPLEALVREVGEEVGLGLKVPKLLLDEFIDWNWCGGGIMGHYWYLYSGTVVGEPTIQPVGVNSVGWYGREELQGLKFEPVWEYWLKKLGYLE